MFVKGKGEIENRAHVQDASFYQNRQGRCALWYAALRGHTTIVEQLVEEPQHADVGANG
ncbi:hypothetical protein BDV29DRAFT_178081 [Aspergillus leporis]|uniref:Ankyrin repeat-containing domain protein n=1 Tax=Aspergillus leporis TaxID=41062 RepID=A0A5N5WY14_9EURO|nr:hypothetical protein BDV29DRAFT_178081 [Aspergillus leporis]